MEAEDEGSAQEREWPRVELDSGSDNADGNADSFAGSENSALPQAGRESDGVRGEAEPGSIDWGKYSGAIRRWERVLGRAAPDPTIPGVNGRPRLSPLFVEWMMGLEPGHVTGHGLRPAQELKALGNGVCPQQALLALHMLLD